jgi:hypothetical protein
MTVPRFSNDSPNGFNTRRERNPGSTMTRPGVAMYRAAGFRQRTASRSADASPGMSRNMLRYKAIARVATFVDTSEHLKHSDPLRMRMRRRPERVSKQENGRVMGAALFMSATLTPRVTFSVWDVRRLQKEAPSTPPGWMVRTSLRPHRARPPKPAFRRDDDGELTSRREA